MQPHIQQVLAHTSCCIFGTYKEHSKPNSKKKKIQLENGQNTWRNTSLKKIDDKRCSTSLAIRKMQLNHNTINLNIYQNDEQNNSDNTNCCRGCRAAGSHVTGGNVK